MLLPVMIYLEIACKHSSEAVWFEIESLASVSQNNYDYANCRGTEAAFRY